MEILRDKERQILFIWKEVVVPLNNTNDITDSDIDGK
jgi:hypothetical protein